MKVMYSWEPGTRGTVVAWLDAEREITEDKDFEYYLVKMEDGPCVIVERGEFEENAVLAERPN